MAHLSADVRLRPIRFGFLLKPDDKAGVLEACRMNTCLWGGRFNPLIPRFKSVPKWWDRHHPSFETAPQIVNGYLDFFEPDFLIEMQPGLAEGLGFDNERVLSPQSVLSRGDSNGLDGCGQSVHELYRHLYDKEFQFQRRHPQEVVDVYNDDGSFTATAACLFGGFPTQPEYAYFRRSFLEIFEPRRVPLEANELAALFRSTFLSPLRIGQSEIEVDANRRDPYLFVINAEDSRDLIDYWNLRAARGNVIPIPVQFINELSAFCREFITNNYRPLQGNPHGVMLHATALFGRSIPTGDIERLFRDFLQVQVNGANFRQDWYPPIWKAVASFGPHERRASLNAGSETSDTAADGDRFDLKFGNLSPAFAEQYGSESRWANVVRIRDWTFGDVAATVFPCDHKKPLAVRIGMGGDTILSTTEGLVHFPRFKNTSNYWQIPDGQSAIAEWLKKLGIGSALSDAGRATQQIVQTLGGFNRVGALAKRGIVKTLDEMARKPITRSAHFREFQNKIGEAVKGDVFNPHSFSTLVENNAVELGLELKCSKCSSWTSYGLNQLGRRLQCGLCLREFAFPITSPGDSALAKWSYRVIGPFALPDYARGGYSAALALRFFSSLIGFHDDVITWSAGRELELDQQTKLEADFILWHQHRLVLGHDRASRTIFGEAKSFGRDVFKPDDVAHMKILAERFPGSVLVFATMKTPDELSNDEVREITKLARWGREFLTDRSGTKAQVIVLTGIELFASFSLSQTWKAIGGKYAPYAEFISHRQGSLGVLADCTQQLYLNMPAYGDWLKEKWDTKRARRAARQAARAHGPQTSA